MTSRFIMTNQTKRDVFRVSSRNGPLSESAIRRLFRFGFFHFTHFSESKPNSAMSDELIKSTFTRALELLSAVVFYTENQLARCKVGISWILSV